MLGMLTLLNPGGKRKRKGSKGRKKYARRRRSARGARSMFERFACARGAEGRFRAARTRCALRIGKRRAGKRSKRAARLAALASKDAWKAGARSYFGAAANPRRRRRRRNGRSARFSYKSRRRSRNYSTWMPAYKNPYWVPQYALNPGGVFKSTLAGFKPESWHLPVGLVGGMLGNALLQGAVNKYVTFIPPYLKSGAPGLLFGVVTSGLYAAAVGLVAPSLAKWIFYGGLSQVTLRAANMYLLPTVQTYLPEVSTFAGLNDGGIGCPGCMGDYGGAPYVWGGDPMSNPESLMAQNQFGDYLTPGDAMGARPLGDYLTPANAMAARPLGYLGYNMNDVVIEGTATNELSTV